MSVGRRRRREDTGRLNRWALTITRCAGDDCGSTPPRSPGRTRRATAIPDGDAVGVTSDITLTGDGHTPPRALTVDISHSFLADLVLSVSKDGGPEVGKKREHYVEDTLLIRTFPVDSFNGEVAAGSTGSAWPTSPAETRASSTPGASKSSPSSPAGRTVGAKRRLRPAGPPSRAPDGPFPWYHPGQGGAADAPGVC